MFTSPIFQSLDVEFQPLDNRLFPRLLPKSVREAVTSFSQQAGEVINTTSQEAKEASKQARMQLSSVGLPGSLEVRYEDISWCSWDGASDSIWGSDGALQSHESPVGLPDSTWKKIQDLREKMSGPTELASQVSERREFVSARGTTSVICLLCL